MARSSRGVQVHPSCMFCGAKPVTKEHVFPQWLKQIVPEIYRRSEHELVRGHSKNSIRMVRDTTGGLSTKTRKVACAKCNNGWMSRLQQLAQPQLIELAHGRWPFITDEHAAHISAWSVMTAMVIETLDYETLATPQWQHLEFAQTRRPPIGWKIWIGLSSDAPDRMFYNYSFKPKLIVDTPQADGSVVQTVTHLDTYHIHSFLMGKLMVICAVSPGSYVNVPDDFLPKEKFKQMYPVFNEERPLCNAYGVQLSRSSELHAINLRFEAAFDSVQVISFNKDDPKNKTIRVVKISEAGEFS